MSLFSGDNELGNMLQEAVKIKSAQMGQKRKTYETWPFFVQHTLFHGEKEDFKAWRELPFDEKLVICERIKNEGNELYKKGNFSDAVDKYEEAPSIIYYCVSSDPGWRKNNRGIDDDVITLHIDKGTTDEHAEQHRKLRLSCCLNIAQCKSKLAKFDEAIVACNHALELEPDNVKALYRRAEARIRPGKSTAYDQDCAIEDLQKAHKIEPTNNLVKKLMTDLQESRKEQREKDAKTFAGMFERGEIYDKSALEEEARRIAKDGAFAQRPGTGIAPEMDLQSLQKRIDNITDDDPVEKRITDAELLRDLYMRNGKEEEARELNEKIKLAKKAVKDRQAPQRSGLDWENPTSEMIEDAKKYDLDLTDPIVIQELKRLEKEGLDGKLPDVDEDGTPSDRAAFSSGTDLPLPECQDETPVPWMRYVIAFAVVWLFWKLVDIGFFVWFGKWFFRRVLGMFGGRLPGDDEDDFDDYRMRQSLFRLAYQRITATFSGSIEDEL